MPTQIRLPSREELRRIRLVSDGRQLFVDHEKVVEAEERGFRYVGNRGENLVLVLMPSGNLLEWAGESEMANFHKYSNQEELRDACQLARIFSCWEGLQGGRGLY